jgi:hypothetical protein
MLWVEFKNITTADDQKRWPRRICLAPKEYAWLLTSAITKYFVQDVRMISGVICLTVDVKSDRFTHEQYVQRFSEQNMKQDKFVIFDGNCTGAIIHMKDRRLEYDFAKDSTARYRFYNELAFASAVENI